MARMRRPHLWFGIRGVLYHLGMRRLLGFLMVASVFAFLFGLFHAGGLVQIGGESGEILRGWQMMLVAVLVLLGAVMVSAGLPRSPGMDGAAPAAIGVGLALLASAFGAFAALHTSPPPPCYETVAGCASQFAPHG